MQTAGIESIWLRYPMGPQVRRFLDVKESQYQGKLHPNPDQETTAAFIERLREAIMASPLSSINELLDLIEELVTMGMGEMVLLVDAQNSALRAADHLRGMLTLSAAAMMEGKFAQAEQWLRDAQTLAPDESSIYVNISQILFHLRRDDEALEWAATGLRVDPNHRRLWEIIASCNQELFPTDAASRVKTLADQHQSWAGLSIASQLEDPNDSLLRAQRLDDCYRAGVVDPQFLVELTGALGATQQFAKIPPIIWRAEQQMTDKKLPWQLYAHGAQAQLAMNKFAEFTELMKKALNNSDMPEEARRELQALAEELKQEQAPTTLH